MSFLLPFLTQNSCQVSEAYSILHIKVHYLRPQDDRYLGRSIQLDDCISNLKLFGNAFGPPRMQDYWGGHQIILTIRNYCDETVEVELDQTEEDKEVHIFT